MKTKNMKSTNLVKNWKNTFKTIWCAVIAALCLVTAMLGALPTGKINQKNTEALAVEADGYASFAEGSTYKFTDREKFATYRQSVLANSNAPALADDTTTVTVTKTANNRGSQQNPYVINDFNTWKQFSDEMSSTSSSATYGDGKYYVLATDLDFSKSTTVRPTIMQTFGGTFYGLGHTIKNYTVTDTTTNTNDDALGLFRWGPWVGTRTVRIADLNFEYSFTVSTQSPSPVCFIGGFFGRVSAAAEVSLLNCHVTGSASQDCYPANVSYGGLIGSSWADTGYNGGIFYIYRCSAKLTINSNSSDEIYAGGIMGGEWDDYNSYIYDCYAELNVNLKNGWSGGVINGCGVILGQGSAATCRNGRTGAMEIIRCAGKAVMKTPSGHGWYYGSLFSIANDSTSTSVGTILTRDCYVYGETYDTQSIWYGMPRPWEVTYYSGANGGLKPSNYNRIDAQRIYYAGRDGAEEHTWGTMDTVNANRYYGEKKTNSELWSNLKSDAKLHPNVWNKTDLGSSYTYTIANSPVRNRTFDEPFTISFYNLRQSGSTLSDEAISGKSAVTYNYTTNGTQYLGVDPVAPTANHTFRGWTLDKSGNGIPVRTLDISNLNGNVKAYAVWEVTGITASIAQTGGTLNEATGAYEAESGGAGINVSADVTVPAEAISMNNLSVTYSWQKDGNTDSSLGMGDVINIGNSGGNGTYSYRFTVKDKTMPLVSFEGICRDSIKVEITGKSTVLDTFRLTSPAYAGATLRGVTFQLIMVDGNREITGTAVWQSENFMIQSGKNTTNVIFTPNDSAYKQMTVAVEFEADQLTLTFRIPDIQNSDLVVNIEYAQSYSAQQIVEMFEAAYAKKIEEDKTFEISVNNRTPKLDGIEINSYNVPFAGALEPKTIEVTFTDPKSYAVTLDYGYENRMENKTAYWGQLIPTPVADRGEEWVLDGWYVTENNVPTTKRWDFSTDRVTSDITLTAKWTQVVLTLEGITVTPKSNPFTVPALTKIEDLGITVNATYSSTVSDEPIVRTLALKTGNTDGYEVRVNGILNGELHVSTTSITVSYRNQTETVEITVTPISLDGYSGQINFPACTKDYTGSPLEIDPLRIAMLPAEIRPYVTDIVITYQKGGVDVDKSEVVAQGVYTAIATFTVDPDYTLSPITTRFTISPPRLAVTVSWSAEAKYTYNGTAQHPKATLTDEDGHQLSESQFEYVILTSGNSKSEGIDAGSYTVSVVIAESVESIYKLAEGMTPQAFTIDKMKVSKPTPMQTSYEYTGNEIAFILNGLESYMSVTGDLTATEVKATPYTVAVTLDGNHEWTEGGSVATYNWTITKATIARPSFESVSVEYNGYEQSIAEKLYGYDASKMTLTGGTGKNAGSYTARITPNRNYTWENESTPVSVSWTITKIKLLVDWEAEDTYEKNGSTRYSPKVTGFANLVGEDRFDPATDASLVRYDGGADKNAVGSYVVKISELRTSWASNYDWSEDLGKGYRIIEAGADPDDPNNPIVPDVSADDPFNPDGNGGGTIKPDPDGNKGNPLPENLPLWQLIVGGVSVVLILLFSTKIAQVRGRTKKAKAATAYSFGGIGALLAMDGAWLGLPQIGWTAIALALVGIAALLFILYLILNKKCLAAEAVAAEAEKRRQAEREEAKEEERRRRDEEFKLMMASMMNGQQSQPFGGDIKELVGEVVASAMQALPAPSAEMQQMLEQQQQMIEAMMTSQQQLQALPAPDNDRIAELEARMAEQQRLAEERAAEQQRIADERLAQQQAMMLEQQRMAEERAAEQQRLSEERMERLMMQLSERETNPSSQTIVQTDDGLRDILEKHGEMLDALMNKENVNKTVYINNEAAVARPEVEPVERLTLREAYALMPKNYQKLFDQVEKYILAKSETVESEGKFAITFKCKAKQFVKLCIKKGFPTMQYTTEGEQLRTLRKKAAQEEGVKVRFKMSELQVYDESTYEVAKGVIDLRAEQVDRDVEYAKEQRLLKRKANKTE